jgi:ketol-acid reductoisomerase
VSKLANSYICPDNGVQVYIRPESPKNYLFTVKQEGFDTQDVDAEFHQKPDATLLLAGYGACEEIYEMGFQQALENKTASFSNTHNIKVVYSAAHEHLCSDAK